MVYSYMVEDSGKIPANRFRLTSATFCDNQFGYTPYTGPVSEI